MVRYYTLINLNCDSQRDSYVDDLIALDDSINIYDYLTHIYLDYRKTNELGDGSEKFSQLCSRLDTIIEKSKCATIDYDQIYEWIENDCSEDHHDNLKIQECNLQVIKKTEYKKLQRNTDTDVNFTTVNYDSHDSDDENDNPKVTKYNTKHIHICSYSNENDMTYVKNLISTRANTPVWNHMDKNVIYAFIVPLKMVHTYVIACFGYTEDLFFIMKYLKKELKCDTFFIKAKNVYGRNDWIIFKNIIKDKYPTLIQNHNSDSKLYGSRLYRLSRELINEFDSYSSTNH